MLGASTCSNGAVSANRGSHASTSRSVAAAPRLASARRAVRVHAVSAPKVVAINKAPPQPITLTESALKHLNKMQQDKGEQLVLRIGVKSGGCSGMSYFMDFVTDPADLKADDVVVALEGGVQLRVDPKSLLYLFNLTLDYSEELIGGGYKFINPNAASSCGCGSSFAV